MSQSTTSIHFLNTSCNGDSTTSLRNLFQSITTLFVKTFFLISNLNLPWQNSWPFPLVLLLVDWEMRPTPPHHNLLTGSCSRYGEVGGKLIMTIFFSYLLGKKKKMRWHMQLLLLLPDSDLVELRIKAQTLTQLQSPQPLPQLPNLLKADCPMM